MDEAELVARAAEGVPWDVSGREPDERRIDAALVTDLCLGRRGPIHPKGVHLVGATVEGPLDLAFTTVATPLRLQRCALAGGLDLTEATGPVLLLQGCTVGAAVQAGGLRTGFVSLDRTEVAGPVVLRGARIDGNVVMSGTVLTGRDATGCSLDLRGAQLGGTLFLRRGARCTGALRAEGASFGGDLELDDTRIEGTDDSAVSLRAVQVHIGGSLRWRDGAVSAGAVWLRRAHVQGDVVLRAVRIEGAGDDGTALHAEGIHVGGSLRLNELSTAGAVRLSDGVVAGSVTVRGARIGGPVDAYGNSFAADGLQVGRSLHLSGGFAADGELRFVGATVDGQLSFEDAAPIPVLALRGARCAELADAPASWPAAGRLELRGFRFDALKLHTGWTERLDWIRRQGFVTWSPDPYEQLATYYSATGDEDAARRIRVAKHDDELTHLRITRPRRSLGYRAWRRPLGWLVGYGYRRSRAGWLLAATLLVAGGLFRLAEDDGAMVPSEPPARSTACGEAYPCFNSLVYGADVVLPVIDFGQDSAYRPVEAGAAGPLWIWARWTFIALGWVLASVVVAAFTGLVQRG